MGTREYEFEVAVTRRYMVRVEATDYEEALALVEDWSSLQDMDMEDCGDDPEVEVPDGLYHWIRYRRKA